MYVVEHVITKSVNLVGGKKIKSENLVALSFASRWPFWWVSIFKLPVVIKVLKIFI